MAFARFMAGPLGRGARILLGFVLIIVGVLMNSAFGWVLAIVGIVPLAAGSFNVCLLGPLFGAPWSGRAVRNR